MKLRILILSLAFLVVSVNATDRDFSDKNANKSSVARIPVTLSVNVTICITTGDVVVRGWDKPEALVSTSEKTNVQFRRLDTTKDGAPAGVIQAVGENDRGIQGNICFVGGDVSLNVPLGATVTVRTSEGDIDIEGVGHAQVKSVSGSVVARRISNGADLVTASGDITVNEIDGTAKLRSISGTILATDMKATQNTDSISAGTTSGDIRLMRIGQGKVSIRSISGQITFDGPLSSGSHYEMTTTEGGILLTIPGLSSFQLNARVFSNGEIVNEFPLVQTNESPSGKDNLGRRVEGTYGSGESVLTLNSFTGSIVLKKKY